MKVFLLFISFLLFSCNGEMTIEIDKQANGATSITPTSDDMIVFVTSATFNNPNNAMRDNTTIAEVDNECENAKRDTRTYKAILTTGLNAGSLLTGSRLNRLSGRVLIYVDGKYQIVTDSYMGLFQTTTTELKVAIEYDAYGNTVASGGRVWTGTLANGTRGSIAPDNSDIYFQGNVTLGRIGEKGPNYINNETALNVELVSAHYYCISQ